MKMIEIICIVCNKSSLKRFRTALFCSQYCGLKHWRLNNREHNIAIKRNWRRKHGVLERGSIEHLEKIKSTLFKKGEHTGEKHPQWKGDQVGYRALHMWIERNLGKASKCMKNLEHK